MQAFCKLFSQKKERCFAPPDEGGEAERRKVDIWCFPSPDYPSLPAADTMFRSGEEKKVANYLAVTEESITFADENDDGALDEWLSQRSAKPSTAVRIC